MTEVKLLANTTDRDKMMFLDTFLGSVLVRPRNRCPLQLVACFFMLTCLVHKASTECVADGYGGDCRGLDCNQLPCSSAACSNSTECQVSSGEENYSPSDRGTAAEDSDHLAMAFCLDGFFGSSCSQECPSNCQDRVCDRVTGHCSHGCLPDYSGDTCSGAGEFNGTNERAIPKQFYSKLTAESKSLLLYILMSKYEDTLERAQLEISRGVQQRNELRALLDDKV